MANESRCRVCGLLAPHICLHPRLVLFRADQYGAYRSVPSKADARKNRKRPWRNRVRAGV